MKKLLSFSLFALLLSGAFSARADGWIVQDSGTSENLEAVWFVDNQTGWVVGANGVILNTTNGGESWNAPVNLTNEDLKDVAFKSSMLGLIVGDNGAIFRTTNGGASWQKVSGGVSANLAAVSFGSDGYVYAAGRDGVILRSMDDGMNWSLLASGAERFRAVFAVANMHAWVVGNDGVIKATTDGGATWTVQSTGSTSDLHDVFFLNADTGWVVGQNDVVYKTMDGGATWMLQNSGVTVGLEAVVFLSNSFGVVVGGGGKTFSTTDGGANWVLQQAPTSGKLNDLFLHASKNAWTVGDNGSIARRASSAPAQKIMLSMHNDLGKILTDGDGRTLYFFTKDAFGASLCENGCKANWPIFYSDNLEIGEGLDPNDFGSTMRGDGDMQTTYKGWPLYYFINDNAPGDVNGEGVIGKWYVAKPDYSVMLVDNQLVGHDGVKYNSSYEPGEEVVQYFVDDYGRTLYIFTKDSFEKNNFTNEDFSNNGVWPIYETENMTAPSALDSSAFSVIDVYGHKQLCYQGWPLYYFGQDSMMRGSNKGVSFPAPGVWPVATASLNPKTGVDYAGSETLPREFELQQNYPNPFNPSTTISFSLPVAGETTLTIYNVLGQPVRTFSNAKMEAGIHQIVWNALDEKGRRQSSGLYYYTLKSGDFTATKRMLLLK